MKAILIILFITFQINNNTAQNVLQKVSSGKIIHLENMPSKFAEARNVDIWLPASYDGKTKHAVLYMHDGQMLFDSATTWNHQAWEADEVGEQLMKTGKTQPFIVVGVWNAGKARHANYFPQKAFESLTADERDFVSKQLQEAGRINAAFQPNSDGYLKFLVKELKPMIDKNYKVHTDRAHTFIAGSSMGGLISMYAICEYPKVFGGAACISTHWPGIFKMKDNPIPKAFCTYLKRHLPAPKNHKIYFDYGTATLDALYPPLQESVDSIMRAAGFTTKSWLTKRFEGQDHSEKSWHSRLHIPLEFLLGNTEKETRRTNGKPTGQLKQTMDYKLYGLVSEEHFYRKFLASTSLSSHYLTISPSTLF